jgi:hypothetical protein
MASGYAIDGKKIGKLCADTNTLHLNDEKTN